MQGAITDEEKRRILAGLRSSVPATRFLTVKKLAERIKSKPDVIKYLASSDVHTMDDMTNLITFIMENDADEVIRREANITFEIVKEVMGPKFTREIIKCQKCDSLLDVGWKHCPICNLELIKMEFGLDRCSKCSGYVIETWKFCANCGNKLKETEEESRCPNCKREIEHTWMVCPFCGSEIKKY